MPKPLDPIAAPFSAQAEMDVGDDISQTHSEREKSITNARTLDDLLNDFDKFAGSTREKGDLFERLVKRILETDPLYSQQFEEVWLWRDWPGNQGEIDTGIDLVAKYRGTEDVCAIQCKFYAPGTQVSYADASKFINAAFRFKFEHRIFVSTTSNIASKAETTFNHDATRTQLLGLDDLRQRDISWPDIWNPENLVIKTTKYDPRPDQELARDKVIEGFKTNDRGKLILPCGTGKTYTALQIAETLVGTGGKVLYLVPSIALLGQTMREWAEQQSIPHRYLGICSDVKAGRRSSGNEDVSISSLEIPVTTDAEKLAPHLNRPTPHTLTVVFSTYQSIEQVINAQNQNTSPSLQRKGTRSEANAGDARADGAFDLVVCDEAHRTTGVEREQSSGSHFTKVHNAEELKANKRLYMTATPRIYSEAAKSKALEIGQVALYSMDDESQYGPEFHRMTFHDAVENNLLTDYKVLVLNIEEGAIAPALQSAIAAGADKELPLDDAAKLVGCASALFDPEPETDSDQKQLLRAIAFASRIKDSKRFKENWPTIVNESKQLLSPTAQMRQLSLAVDHVDGAMNALERSRKLEWLRASEEDEYEIRVLNNARCLTEGVDVPALDAVLFMQPRRSLVDVVQAVGRVMRRAPNKKFGYIILPIVIPAGVDPNDALDDNERYRVVWEVLQALRSHDERLDAEINKIDLQKAQDGGRINVIGVGGGDGNDESAEKSLTEEVTRLTQYQLPGLFINNFRAKVVEKVGDRQYWDRWAKDVAEIHDRLETRIGTLIPDAGAATDGALTQVRLRFESLMQAMRATTNEALSDEGAISIVAQHMITEPVFQALFESHDFAKSNPVAASLNQFVELIKQHGLAAELEQLDPFYASIKRRAEGLDNAESRRKVLEELYENFFKNALPKEAQRLGVVYTPHEIVDFILNSADYLLREEFGKSLSDEGVHILDPFAGMGTFIWRLLANPDLIRDEDLERKFREELHANEILPLAYYMASVNIEEAFRERIEARDNKDPGYLAFDGMVWRDTFNAMTEGVGQQSSMQFMQDNAKRSRIQDKTEVSLIVGNPPYSRRQVDANDANPNVQYADLRSRIQESYSSKSRSRNTSILHDHYTYALRWATDRLPDSGGMISMVTNGSFIDNNAGSGIRASFYEEFDAIYVFNLRGNQRTQGEISRREGGKIFGSGSRAPIAISVFVKNPSAAPAVCRIYYKDIGDYLTREEKLSIVESSQSVSGVSDWVDIVPDKSNDWIDVSDPTFANHIPLGDKRRQKTNSRISIFADFALGTATNRDAWVYDFGKENLIERTKDMVERFNEKVDLLRTDENADISKLTQPDPRNIKWNESLKRHLARGRSVEWSQGRYRTSAYRPFNKMRLFFDPKFVNSMNRQNLMYPIASAQNETICVPAVGNRRGHSVVMTDALNDLNALDATQCFPRYVYQEVDNKLPEDQVQPGLVELGPQERYDNAIRHDNILDEALDAYLSNYNDSSITKDDIFYYVYGLLHSPLYKERYQNNLRRELPRIPMAPDFWAFSNAGRALSDLHLNYETCEEYPLKIDGYMQGETPPSEHLTLTARKMRYTDKQTKNAIRVNDHITISDIPPEAHRYIVNGRTPLEWIIDRYHIKTDKPSGIVHDPNKWFEETGDNIVSMIKRITQTSIETAKIIDTLPTPFTDGWTPD